MESVKEREMVKGREGEMEIDRVRGSNTYFRICMYGIGGNHSKQMKHFKLKLVL